MARIARVVAPGSVQHVIARFVDRAFRLRGQASRREYLTRLGRALAHTDWRLLGYALMSSHIHLVLRAGDAPLAALVKRAHVGFALALNRRERRLGPVFAERPRAIGLPPARAGDVLAYVHNNPVRAGVVNDAVASPWTSHRAYLGVEPAPPWLDVTMGLALAGLDGSDAGRAAFEALVRARADDPRDDVLADRALTAVRRGVRRSLGSPVEIAAPRVGSDARGPALVVDVQSARSPLRPRWGGDLDALLARSAARTHVAVATIRSCTRRRDVVRARRLVLVAGVQHLGRGVGEVGALVGISASAASRLLSRERAALVAIGPLAEAVALECRRG